MVEQRLTRRAAPASRRDTGSASLGSTLAPCSVVPYPHPYPYPGKSKSKERERMPKDSTWLKGGASSLAHKTASLPSLFRFLSFSFFYIQRHKKKATGHLDNLSPRSQTSSLVSKGIFISTLRRSSQPVNRQHQGNHGSRTSASYAGHAKGILRPSHCSSHLFRRRLGHLYLWRCVRPCLRHHFEYLHCKNVVLNSCVFGH
jgi:hypothetical protein